MSIPHKKIEPNWQKKWSEAQIFKADSKSNKPKYYVLDMFPYPSGSGLHVGHPEGYTATDILARFKRAQGFNVLHPMGWDAFGLPAEQYAIQTGIHPAITTQKAIDNFRRQLQAFGFSYDWTREISTCDPKYYKWTQFIFLKLFEKGLAYQKEVPVNWCPELKTVLANEEVIDGKSERGGHPVVRLPMKQWMLKITAYAERLLKDLDKLDWPERTKEGQRNWIGKSEGARVHFPLAPSTLASATAGGTSLKGDTSFEIFTTRPDTIFGATFMVLAPEHPLVEVISSTSQKKLVQEYKITAARKSDVDRQIAKEKSGVFTGAFAINPLTKKEIPIWIADYVLMDYGTGAIMAVPAHDTRDFEFAKAHDLEILRVISSDQELPFEGEGTMVNSGFLNGTPSKLAISKTIEFIENNKLGLKTIQYKLRDWLFSRQRFWGEPFPIVQFPEKGLRSVGTNELPVLLPSVEEYEPSSSGESPLARVTEFKNYKDPSTGEAGQRNTDTMPGSAGSSWYFLRYTDPLNDSAPFSFDAQKYWMPVDLYLGGAEHTVGHLLYARFWQKVLFDAGLVSSDEPFRKLVHQGMILGEDGEKMSKSRGNVINPDDVIEKFGADSLRVYLMFMGPLDRDKPWSTRGIEGVRRFLDRVWRIVIHEDFPSAEKTLGDQNTPSERVVVHDTEPTGDINKLLHKTIKKVTEDIENLSFNTAISQMMILTNELYKSDQRPRSLMLTFAQLLMPFAPHLAEELWKRLGGNGFVSTAAWPKYDAGLVVDDVITMGVQVNGKMRGTIEITKDATEPLALELAHKIPAVTNALGGKPPKKVIYKPGQILNIIVG